MRIMREHEAADWLWGSARGNTELKFFAHDLGPRWRLSALLSTIRSTLS
jgi:hypothetical protein